MQHDKCCLLVEGKSLTLVTNVVQHAGVLYSNFVDVLRLHP